MLKIDRLSKSFGDKVVLEEFSCEFDSGSRTLITGQSGSGKTTLLRIIAGLETADSGSVSFSAKAAISFMFQEPRLFPWLTVCDNVNSVLDKPERERAIEILDSLGLGSEADSLPCELSGGMQRRVSLARTLLFPADIYIFDEPFAGLDSGTAQVAADVIFRYTEGKTVIIVSHDRSMLPEDINIISI